MTAEPERLAKGEPALSGEAVLDDCPPQDQHIDPGISALGGSVARHGEWRLDRRGPPGLGPRDTARLQLGDDLVGDFGVKARAGAAGADSCGVFRHRGSPRRAPEASPPIFNPSRQNWPELSLLSDADAACTLGNGIRGSAAVFAPGMEARRVKIREAGFSAADSP